MNLNFLRMCSRNGGYSLPWLITITSPLTTLRYINDVSDIVYGGNTYKASTFNYNPSASDSGMSGGGSLQIAAADANEAESIIALIESAISIQLDVVGLLLESGDVSEIKAFSHSNGTVTWNGRTATFTMEADDRLSMTFPALIFSHYNNRGNG